MVKSKAITNKQLRTTAWSEQKQLQTINYTHTRTVRFNIEINNIG